jgi:hypothetical protein
MRRVTTWIFHQHYWDGWMPLGRSQWPRGLRRRSAAARLLRLWVRIPPEAWMFVCCDCCVLWGKGLCDGLITRPEESYRLWCVAVGDLETSKMRRTWPTGGLLRPPPQKKAAGRNRWSMFWFESPKGVISCRTSTPVVGCYSGRWIIVVWVSVNWVSRV